MSFSKKGQKFPRDLTKSSLVLKNLLSADGDYNFNIVISEALHEAFGDTHAAVKTVIVFTGVGERTVKNWFQGKNGPNRRNLLLLAMHSDLIFEAILIMANRQELLLAKKIVDNRDGLVEIVEIINNLLVRS